MHLQVFYIVGYQIESFEHCCHPTGWEFQGRNLDSENWKTINTIENTNKLNSHGLVDFPAKRSFFNQYRIFFKPTNCYSGEYPFHLGIKSFDLILTKNFTCQGRISLQTSQLLFILILMLKL